MKEKGRKTSAVPGERLLQILTVSLFIILLAFFILLNAMAPIDEGKKRLVVGSVVKSFGGPFERGGEMGASGMFADGSSPIEFSDLVGGEENTLEEIRFSVFRRKSVVRIPAHLLFKGYGTRIEASGHVLLKRLATIINKNNFPVEITGHMDNVPVADIAGITSRELSSLRSMRVLRYLVEKGGVDPARLTASGWGPHRPFFSNKTPESRRLNRRIDITVIHDRPVGNEGGVFIFRDFFFRVWE